MDERARSAPLAGVRVLDLTRVLAGPFGTMILADLGAEVVKVERPEGGDDSRHFGPFLASGASAYFASINRGKKSIVLDLREDRDRGTLLRLAAIADVFVENFRPDFLPRLGLGPEQLLAHNPRLVYASASGFGRAGKGNQSRPAYDIVVQALSGLMSITGIDRASPVRVGTSISDIVTGMYLAIGVLAALHERERTGRGTVLDLAMLDCTVSVLENAISRYQVTGQVPEPLGTRHPSITPFQAFRAADGWIVIAAGNDALWRRLCGVLEADDLADDDKLATNELRTRHQPYVEAQLTRILGTRTTADWLDKLGTAGIPSAPIRTIAEVASDPHLAARGMLHSMHDAAGQHLLTAGSPLRMAGQSPRLSDHAPQLGEHGSQVLRDWLGGSNDHS